MSHIPFLDKIENKIFSEVQEGSDEDIFISSYLHGHISLVAASLKPEHKIASFIQSVETSLNNAFTQQELSESDQGLVWKYWQKLQTDS